MSDMIDLGYTDENEAAIGSGSNKKNEKRYPSISMYQGAPEALSAYKIGDELRIEAVIKIKEMGENNDGRSATLEVQKMNILSKSGKKSREEVMEMDSESRAKYQEESVGLK